MSLSRCVCKHGVKCYWLDNATFLGCEKCLNRGKLYDLVRPSARPSAVNTQAATELPTMSGNSPFQRSSLLQRSPLKDGDKEVTQEQIVASTLNPADPTKLVKETLEKAEAAVSDSVKVSDVKVQMQVKGLKNTIESLIEIVKSKEKQQADEKKTTDELQKQSEDYKKMIADLQQRLTVLEQKGTGAPGVRGEESPEAGYSGRLTPLVGTDKNSLDGMDEDSNENQLDSETNWILKQKRKRNVEEDSPPQTQLKKGKKGNAGQTGNIKSKAGFGVSTKQADKTQNGKTKEGTNKDPNEKKDDKKGGGGRKIKSRQRTKSHLQLRLQM